MNLPNPDGCDSLVANDPYCEPAGPCEIDCVDGCVEKVAPISVMSPPPALLVKLGSIARHAEELLSPGAHRFDLEAVKSLLADPEVVAWMDAADALALLPVPRSRA